MKQTYGQILKSSALIASFTFGSTNRTVAVALLALVFLFRLGAVLGAALGEVTVFPISETGVVPEMILAAASALLTSWRYWREIQLVAPRMLRSQVRREQAALLKFGVAFMASAVVILGAAPVGRTRARFLNH